MTNIVKRKADEILTAKDYNKAQTSSLLKKLKAINSKDILLIDTSGSMSDAVSGGQSKHKIMLDIIQEIEESRIFVFSSFVKEITNKYIPNPDGGTNMALAFLKMHEISAAKVVLVTDGMPDSQEAALKAAQGLNLTIIYIGPDPAPKFLKILAKNVGGTFENFNLLHDGKAGLLKSKIKGLLNA